MLNVTVPEIILYQPRILAQIRQGIATTMTQHMRMRRNAHTSLFSILLQ